MNLFVMSEPEDWSVFTVPYIIHTPIGLSYLNFSIMMSLVIGWFL